MASMEKDEILIAALLCNPTRAAAAKAAGIGETKLRERLRDPNFRKMYDDARREFLDQSTAYIQSILGEAIAKMREIMNDPNASHQVQLNAANSIASTSHKMTEQADILAQLAELKKAVFPNE